jgi:hypothetical protein
MEFPAQQLLILLELVRGKRDWGPEVFDAAMDVLKYAYHNFINKTPVPIVSLNDFDAESAIESLLNEEAKGISPTIWISLGIWILQKVIERMAK